MRSRVLVPIIIAFLASSSAAMAENVSFEGEVIPIFMSHCVSCHVTGDEQGGLGLAPSLAYENLVDVPSIQSDLLRVEPGNPESSYLIHKLEGTHVSDGGGSGAQMPFGLPKIDQESITYIRRWISQGALNN